MLESLITRLHALGAPVRDLRGKLPVHATKTFARRDPTALRGLVAHHSAGATGGVDRVADVARYHVGPNHISPTGCPGICYSLAITDVGEICALWDLDRSTWSQADKSKPGDENDQWLSVLLLGDFRSPSNPKGGEPSVQQFRAYLGLVLACREIWGPGFRLTGHYDFGKPACPGSSMEGLIKAISASPPGLELSIRKLQEGLAALGYLPPGPASVDGLWGPKTRGAVAAFQRDQGLVITGVTSETVWSCLIDEGTRRAGGVVPGWASR